MKAAILMYHRVCELSPATECYFERGTAVTPGAFGAQLSWLAARYELRTVRDLVFGPPVERSTVALTFDDGYHDVVEHVLPACRRLGVPATAYVCSATVGINAKPLWFDRYYEMVSRIRERTMSSVVREFAGSDDHQPSLRWWVRGPFKERLRTASRELREELLGRMSSATQFDQSTSSVRYLEQDDLRSLQHAGWEIGGHGAAHERLTDANPEALAAELKAAANLLVDVDQPRPWTFAYPDGAVDDRVLGATASAGFAAAVTVDTGFFDSATSRYRIPRVLCRGDTELPHVALR